MHEKGPQPETRHRIVLIFRGALDSASFDLLCRELELRPGRDGPGHGCVGEALDGDAPARTRMSQIGEQRWLIEIAPGTRHGPGDPEGARWQSTVERAAAAAGLELVERRAVVHPSGADAIPEEVPAPRLRPLGLYREMFDGRHSELPSLFESFTDRQIDDRDRVLEYLRNAPPVLDVLDVLTDVVNNTDPIRSASSLLSDEVWIWRVDSIHYLASYNLDIPDAFLAHVRDRDYRPPDDVDYTEEFEAEVLKYF